MHIETLPLSGGHIGIERETLRSNADGELASSRHPEALGNVYTHPNITIDYGEALLEFVSDPHHSPQAAYQQLLQLQQFSAQHLGAERHWPPSMPCRLPDNPEHIDIGYFGESNGGKLRRLYRIGLAYRYGRPMQMIAGVHFNYSPPPALWQALADREGVALSDDWKNVRYMSMLRNIQKHGWLICHLFGASPAVDESFQPAQNLLDRLHRRSLSWRNATTLRMSQLGYQNKVDFSVSFNHLYEYIRDLGTAVLTPAPQYEYFGLKDPAGNYRQISTHILQIANEYYSGARPKQPLKKGELPVIALHNRGIAYIELRLLDSNPYDPAGISLEQIRFLECFMLWCLINPCSPFDNSDYNEANHNRLRTACCGLSPDFQLFREQRQILARDWAAEILQALLPVAENLDHAAGSTDYQDAIARQIAANQGQNLRLPEQVQAELAEQEFLDWGIALQNRHQTALSAPIPANIAAQLQQQSRQSLQAFADIEAQAAQQIAFDDYLAHYFDPLAALFSKN